MAPKHTFLTNPHTDNASTNSATMSNSISKPLFDTVTFGSGSYALCVQLLKFPRTGAPLLEEVQAFAYFEDVIHQHRTQFSSATLQQSYAANAPVSSSAAASEESNRVSLLLHDPFFAVSNLACQGFFTADGKIVTMALAPGDRAPSIKFVLFEATVRPTATSPDLHAVPPAVVSFYLQLPQSIPPVDDVQPASEDAPVETSPPPADQSEFGLS
jgi:hypothetical protein